MNLLVVSHKECWPSACSPTGYATGGGFPFQIQALSELFDTTVLIVPVRRTPAPGGLAALSGHRLEVRPVAEPAGRGWSRKAALLLWLPRFLPRIWRAIQRADAVHAPVPGDLGALALLLALVLRKRLFVRHCGTWGHRQTLADRMLMWLLPRIAGGRRVVWATGGGDRPPVPEHLAIEWIFSSTLTARELAALSEPRRWRRGEPLRLVCVARLDPGKNIESAVRALGLIQAHYPLATLEIAGEGPCREPLEALARAGVEGVSLLGNRSHAEVLALLQRCHIFVFPTRVAEGFPKAVLEAMACGLVVIASAVSVVPHLLGGQRGIVLDDPEPQALAAAVLELITDEDRMAAMARQAQAQAREYSLEQWQARIAERLTASWGPLRSAPVAADRLGRGEPWA